MIDDKTLEQIIQPYISADAVLGMGIAIVRGQEVVHANGFGRTSVEEGGIPVTAQTLFAIGSTSKIITALLIMRLVEQGALELDRPVVDYLPGYTFTANPVWGQKITLRHLLSHTSGLASGDREWGPSDPDALRRWVWEEMAHFALLAEPGCALYYSNGPCLAAHVAEAVTSHAFPQLVAEQVFAPLGMTRSTYDRLVAMTYPLALPHDRDEAGKLSVVHHFADNAAGNPDGHCLSTVDDMAKVMIMLLNQGRIGQEQYLTPASMAAMQAIHGDSLTAAANTLRAALMRYWGLGLGIGDYKGVRVVRHAGTLQGMFTMCDLFPAQGIGVVTMSNYCNANQRRAMLFQLYDQLLSTPAIYHYPEPAVLTGDAHQALWPQHRGAYLSPWGTLLTIAVQAGQLTITVDNEGYLLTAVTADQYYFIDAEGNRTPVAFLPEQFGPTQILLLDGDLHNRIELPSDFTFDLATLAAYTGLYANYAEGNTLVGFYIGAQEEGLFVYPAAVHGCVPQIGLSTSKSNLSFSSIAPNLGRTPVYGHCIPLDEENGVKCTPLTPTTFVAPGCLLEFTVNEDSSVRYVTRKRGLRYWPVKDRRR
ncbi:MAG: serine hydrolase domain-containing protein [Caldilineaceae bacterium]